MMNRKLLSLCIFVLLAACSSSDNTSSSNTAGNSGQTNTSGSGNSQYTGGLIIDHRAVAGFDRIPANWLAAAKQRTIHFAHTSHGSQIIDGALALEAASASYSFAVTADGGAVSLPNAETPAALRLYDGNAPLGTYITPDLYWDGTTGLDATRGVANTNVFNYSLWSWCGQQSSNDSGTVQRYLDNLGTLENEYPNMRFIYMTGHTDGSGTSGTLNTNNKRVRQYVSDHNKVLFDFADIESYDPDGNYYPNTGNPDGACNWCDAWCAGHPADCTDLPASCAHTHPYNCKIKAKAFWYLMARLAGWDGQ